MPAEIDEIVAGMARASRQKTWLVMIANEGAAGMINTPVPWDILSSLRCKKLCAPEFRTPHYFEISSDLGQQVAAALRSGR